jgi:putative SOS response-associated peptidase YedK
MCGRYASSRDARDLASAFSVEEPPEQVLPPSWNVAPTDPVYAVLQRGDVRALRAADGYYEWQRDGPRKQPWFLTPRDGEPLAMAGLYEVWAPPEGGDRLWTCTVITTDAADELGHIHDRTPLVVPRDAWERWLDPELEDPGEDVLVPGVSGRLDAWPVGPAVGNVRNNGPELVAPVSEPPALF